MDHAGPGRTCLIFASLGQGLIFTKQGSIPPNILAT